MGKNPTAHIILTEITLYIPQAHSLKQKRSVVKSLITRVQNKFNVSIAEIGELELWQKAVLGAVIISLDRVFLEQSIQKLQTFIESEIFGKAELLEYKTNLIA